MANRDKVSSIHRGSSRLNMEGPQMYVMPARLASGSYRGDSENHMLVASFSEAGASQK
jgi:hypothetical protein